MSEQIHADKAEEQVSPDSGLLLSSEPLGGERLSALGDADASDTTGDDTDAGLGDADSSDSDSIAGGDDDAGGDTDASDEADADGTDGGDSIESESGLGGENPLGINRARDENAEGRRDTRDA